ERSSAVSRPTIVSLSIFMQPRQHTSSRALPGWTAEGGCPYVGFAECYTFWFRGGTACAVSFF
ncbi:MAG: hypothetical protein WBZ14_12765, partial [Terriglobales bacterium]